MQTIALLLIFLKQELEMLKSEIYLMKISKDNLYMD